jgi:uncharacterized membrane protein YfcA
LTVIALGLLAGVVAGFFGVGGGVLFVPTLTLIAGMSVVEAEATSLLAIIPVAIVGALNQRRYGNVVVRDALILGLLAVPGALAGVVVVNAVPEDAVRIGFVLLTLFVAWRLALSGWHDRAEEPSQPG